MAHDKAVRADSAERTKAHAAEQARKADEARKHQARGVQRLKETQEKHKERQAEVDQVRDAQFQHDAQRILALKSSMDTINRQIQSSNETRSKKQQKQRAEQEQRRKDLLNEGANPHEVWRREDMDAEKEKDKQKKKQKDEVRADTLMEQMIEEDKRYKKQRGEEKAKRQDAEEFQREMGNYAKEKKIAAYIRKMTIGNVDVIDPTGTAIRIDPSKITVQKTNAFGLGQARPRDIERVEQGVRAATARMATWKPPRPDSPSDFGGIENGDDDAPEDSPTHRGAGQPDAAPKDGKLWVPKLTKLEEQYLAAARERQKENSTSVQKCWGKEFKGDAFLAKPSVIAFHDFEVGKRYRQVVEVTNVSLTFNQFKLLPLDDKYKDFFEIQFVPPGRMSAGVTRYITIWFCPKVSSDIQSTFPILAKTGRIEFPLVCKTKKTILHVTPQDANANPVIDFGQVLSGESAHRVLHLKNTGALAAAFTLEPAEEGSGFVQMLSWTPRGKGELAAHATTNISFTFKPEAMGDFETVLELDISNGAVGDALYGNKFSVLVRASCTNVPIYVEKDVYDMKLCVFRHIFRESVVLHNRQSVAMQIEVERPKDIIGELHLNPSVAYIQGGKEQAVQVKFSPKDDFLDKNPQYRDAARKDVPGAFCIPVRIVGADQVLPVCTKLVGTLTTNSVSFEPSVLSFGRCFVGSAVSNRITVINESLLPQRFAFMRLPAFLSVQEIPNDVLEEEDAHGGGTGTAVLDGGGDGTLGTLLPQERRQLCVTYAPEAAMEMDYKISFKVISGSLCVGDFAIECKGQGVAPTMALSHTRVDMASIPCDAISKESVVITNVSKVPYAMNLLLPPPQVSALCANPICCVLQPKESRRVQFEFKPTEDYMSLLQQPQEDEPQEPEEGGGAGEAAEGDDAGKDASTGQISPEEYRQQKLLDIREQGGRRWESSEKGTVHASWKLAIFMRPHAAKSGQDPGGRAAAQRSQVMYLGVGTCVLSSVLTMDPKVLDFGEVTAQQRKILPITLQNRFPSEPQKLQLEALPENQCFTVLNASRSIGAKPFQLMVEFNPQLVQIYQTTLQLQTQNTRVQIPLHGRGVRPVLRIEPEDGVIHLGAVVYGRDCKDYTQAKLEIKNESPYELCYDLETVIQADPNHVGPSPFSLSPSTGVVEANGRKTVVVTFRPHRPMGVFRGKVLVNVPNQKEQTYVYLYGHCFKQQAYALYGMKFGPFSKSHVSKDPAFVDSLAVGVGSGASVTGEFEYPRAMLSDFTLVFEHGERMKYMLVSACVPPGTPSAPQSSPNATYDFQIQPSDFANLFTVEAPEGGKPDKQVKGTIDQWRPGERPADMEKKTKVVFRYSPPENASLTYGDVNLDLLSGIGQWITCKVKGVLAGGYAPPTSPTQEITVELRAYLEQI